MNGGAHMSASVLPIEALYPRLTEKNRRKVDMAATLLLKSQKGEATETEERLIDMIRRSKDPAKAMDAAVKILLGEVKEHG